MLAHLHNTQIDKSLRELINRICAKFIAYQGISNLLPSIKGERKLETAEYMKYNPAEKIVPQRVCH